MSKKTAIPIEASAELIHKPSSNYYFIRHIFYALREHSELLLHSDYIRLYDEAKDYLFRYAVKHCDWNKDEREWGYEQLDFLADLFIKYDKLGDKLSIDTIDSFLAERRKAWAI
nr:hypothetical protein [Oscillospiraceae bacterium]